MATRCHDCRIMTCRDPHHTPRRVALVVDEDHRIRVVHFGRTVGFIDRMSSGKFRGYNFQKGIGIGPLSTLAATRHALGRAA